MKKSPQDIAILISENGARIIDVRKEADRAAKSTIPDSEGIDLNASIAAGEMGDLLDITDDVAEPIVFVCNTGGKCGRAAAFLRENGYNAYSVDGGMDAWIEAGLDTDPPTSPATD